MASAWGWCWGYMNDRHRRWIFALFLVTLAVFGSRTAFADPNPRDFHLIDAAGGLKVNALSPALLIDQYHYDQLARLTTLAQPHLDFTLFGGGFLAEDYYAAEEGIQAEQSVTEGLGIVG